MRATAVRSFIDTLLAATLLALLAVRPQYATCAPIGSPPPPNATRNLLPGYYDHRQNQVQDTAGSSSSAPSGLPYGTSYYSAYQPLPAGLMPYDHSQGSIHLHQEQYNPYATQKISYPHLSRSWAHPPHHTMKRSSQMVINELPSYVPPADPHFFSHYSGLYQQGGGQSSHSVQHPVDSLTAQLAELQLKRRGGATSSQTQETGMTAKDIAETIRREKELGNLLQNANEDDPILDLSLRSMIDPNKRRRGRPTTRTPEQRRINSVRLTRERRQDQRARIWAEASFTGRPYKEISKEKENQRLIARYNFSPQELAQFQAERKQKSAKAKSRYIEKKRREEEAMWLAGDLATSGNPIEHADIISQESGGSGQFMHQYRYQGTEANVPQYRPEFSFFPTAGSTSGDGYDGQSLGSSSSSSGPQFNVFL